MAIKVGDEVRIIGRDILCCEDVEEALGKCGIVTELCSIGGFNSRVHVRIEGFSVPPCVVLCDIELRVPPESEEG